MIKVYIFFNILPRFFLVMCLLIDVFIKGKISTFYTYTFLTLIILIGKLIIHAFEQLKELCILKVESMNEPEGLRTTYLTPEEEAEEYSEEDLYLLHVWNEPRQTRKLYRKVVEFQTIAMVYTNKQYWVLPDLSDKYMEDFDKKNNIIYYPGYLQSAQRDIDFKKMTADLYKYYFLGIQVSISLFKYTYSVNAFIVKKLQLITNMLFLLCWSRVLYLNLGISNLDLMGKILEIILSIQYVPINPFI